MATKKITKRWLLNSMGAIVVVLIILEIGIGVGIKNYYYNSVKQILTSRLNVISELAEDYYEDDAELYDVNIKKMVEDFEYRSEMELMAVNSDGKAIVASSGFLPENDGEMPDYVAALESQSGYGEYWGEENGEKILAVTKVLQSGGEYSAVRAIVSITMIDRQIVTIILAAAVVEIAIILFVLFSSSYFINSIVIPIGAVGDSARKIAQGDFDTRIKKRNDDELGELCDTINYMAGELEATEKMKNEFISSVSHELRTPLTAIKGWSETVMDSEDEETRKRGMRVIISETERLSLMVEELLDFSRIQSGRMKMIMDKMDIAAEVEEAAMMYTEKAKREGMELICEVADEAFVVYGDKNRLRQVFVNIIDNAIKYSDSGGRVRIRLKAAGGAVRIEVADSGIGISEEDLPNIKRKFYKGTSTRRGSGIGLAVADEIITRHGGSLDISSVKGVGTTVTITLPLMNRNTEKKIGKEMNQ